MASVYKLNVKVFEGIISKRLDRYVLLGEEAKRKSLFAKKQIKEVDLNTTS